MTEYDANMTAETLVQDFAEHIRGKTILVTGASDGGLEAFFVQQIAVAKPKCIIITARTHAKAEAFKGSVVATGAPIKILDLDFASLASVRAAAEVLNGWTDIPSIDVLVNNAGIMAVEYSKTEDGFERYFAVNHLGPWLFTNLIMDKIMASKQPRIVFVTSDGHRLSPMRWADHDFPDGENYNRWMAYGQSKAANMLTALYLAEKGPKGLNTNSLDPGVIITHLSEHEGIEAVDKLLGHNYGWETIFNFKEPDVGVSTHVYAYAAFAPELRGLKAPYLIDNRFADSRKDNVKPWATSLIEAEMMWELSEKLTGSTFSFQ